MNVIRGAYSNELPTALQTSCKASAAQSDSRKNGAAGFTGDRLSDYTFERSTGE
jgi:hypothetical protein